MTKTTKKKKADFKDIDFVRHLSVFDPDKFGKSRIDVIGCGATGSKLVLELAKLGCTNIHAWDFDKIEAHNIPNQLFGPKHIGMQKVEALRKVVLDLSGVKINIHDAAFTGEEEDIGEVIFILTDTMASRKEIWHNVKDRIELSFMVETRMGVAEARIYTMEPALDDHEKYEATLYDDDDAETSACGSQVTVGMTASVLASMAVWAFIEWRGGDKPPNESIFCTKGQKMFLESNFKVDTTKVERLISTTDTSALLSPSI